MNVGESNRCSRFYWLHVTTPKRRRRPHFHFARQSPTRRW